MWFKRRNGDLVCLDNCDIRLNTGISSCTVDAYSIHAIEDNGAELFKGTEVQCRTFLAQLTTKLIIRVWPPQVVRLSEDDWEEVKDATPFE